MRAVATDAYDTLRGQSVCLSENNQKKFTENFDHLLEDGGWNIVWIRHFNGRSLYLDLQTEAKHSRGEAKNFIVGGYWAKYGEGLGTPTQYGTWDLTPEVLKIWHSNPYSRSVHFDSYQELSTECLMTEWVYTVEGSYPKISHWFNGFM